MERRRQWFIVVLVATALLPLAGCPRRPVAAPAAAKPAPPPQPEPENATAPQSDSPGAAVAPPPRDGEPLAPSEPRAHSDAAEPQADQASSERFIIFTLGQPLIVELRLAIDGQPHTAALTRLVDSVLQFADADSDGRTTWKELCADKRIKYGQYGNLAIENENSEQQIIERYDIGRDGIVERSELPRFLTRNAGSSRPFSVRGSFNYRTASRRSAPTWKAIDLDEDGSLSKQELAEAGSRLAAYDADDDEILLAADLQDRDDAPDRMLAMSERRRGPDAVRLLGEHADWSSIQQACEQHYGGGRFLRSGAFGDSSAMFAALDANADGRLARDEYRRLNDLPPQFIVKIEFGKRDGTNANLPSLKLIRSEIHRGELPAAPGERQNTLTFPLDRAILTLYTNDATTGGSDQDRAQQALEMFDQDKNGYLEATELPEGLRDQLGRFEAIDTDEDGKIFPQEIATFLGQQQAGLRSQIHARVTDDHDVLFTLLDQDGDRRLVHRELQAAPKRLAPLDRDQDGQLTTDELPELILIGVARGSIETPDNTFAMPIPRERTPTGSEPKWFKAMDANQDGEISRREFLGTPQQFTHLDANRDGLLQASEVASADSDAS